MALNPRILAAVLAALLLAGASDAQAARRKRARRAPTPKPRPPLVFYGPPAPPLLRAAGSCASFGPDFLMVAEVGQSGRAFRIDPATVVAVRLSKGARVRVLYVDTPEGPLAREVLPGPEEVTPTPRSRN